MEASGQIKAAANINSRGHSPETSNQLYNSLLNNMLRFFSLIIFI